MAKTAKANGTRKSVDESRKIKANKGQEGHFYKGFPRGEAYGILLKAPKQTMVVKTFLDKIEKLPKVKDRKQARGIVAKMVNKPGDDGQRNGQVARYV
jgi:hypothetical protein